MLQRSLSRIAKFLVQKEFFRYDREDLFFSFLTPWKTCSPLFGNCNPRSLRGRTLFEKRGTPKKIATLEGKSQAEGFWNDQKAAKKLFSELSALKKQWEPVSALAEEVTALLELAEGASEDDRRELEADALKLIERWKEVSHILYLSGPYDALNAYITISSGAGGTEAQDWAEMLTRMYLRYCERRRWKTEVLEKTHGQEAGIKSVTIHVQGDLAYGHLKNERGTHRLVRLSPFNAKNLRQTSFALVEVLPELEGTEEIEVNSADLRVDTYRAGGAGGQHVNKTESAVRITHIPSGIVAACQNERSQGQNREQAMKIIRAKLLQKKQEEDAAKLKGLRGSVESADFGSQIRSYVLHPYKMVKDLRTDTERSDPENVLDGDLDDFITAELRRSASK